MPVRQIFFLFKLFSANTYFYLQIYCIDMIFYTCHWILSVIGKLHIWAKKKKAKFPLKIAVKQSKGFQKWLPIAIISLSFLSFLLFHFSPTTFPPTYLELFLFSLLWKNYCEKKKNTTKTQKNNNAPKMKRGFTSGGVRWALQPVPCPPRGTGRRRSSSHGISDWEAPFFCPNKTCSWLCSLLLAAAVLAGHPPGDLDTARGDRGKWAGKNISSISNCRGLSSAIKETLPPNSLRFMALSVTWHYAFWYRFWCINKKTFSTEVLQIPHPTPPKKKKKIWQLFLLK